MGLKMFRDPDDSAALDEAIAEAQKGDEVDLTVMGVGDGMDVTVPVKASDTRESLQERIQYLAGNS